MPPPSVPPLDCLAVGAHPDDAELFAGGTLARMTRLGRRVAVLDLTRGECASRGAPDRRAEQAREAAEILGISARETLDLGDTRLDAADPDARRAVVEALRRLRPRLILTHAAPARHPDHRAAHALIRDAAFFAHVAGFDASGEPWNIEALAFFPGHTWRAEPRADWVVDVAATAETKRAALAAYDTQFLAEPTPDDPHPTHIASRAFWDYLDARDRVWGHRIGVERGEPFLLDRPPHAAHPLVRLTQ